MEFWANKRVLITGAGRGIGRELVKTLNQYGAHVIAISKTTSHLLTLKKECPNIEIISVDLRDWEETKKAVENINVVDCLVNNAGYAELSLIGEIDEKICDRHFDVNVKPIINITQEVIKKMKQAGRKGSIVNVSSQASMVGLKSHLVYCASKGAVDQLTRVFALELGPFQIRVNSVNPTVVLTDMSKVAWSDPKSAQEMIEKIPLRKFAETKNVIDVIIFLLSDQAEMITGAIVPIDGGFTAT